MSTPREMEIEQHAEDWLGKLEELSHRSFVGLGRAYQLVLAERADDLGLGHQVVSRPLVPGAGPSPVASTSPARKAGRLSNEARSERERQLSEAAREEATAVDNLGPTIRLD